MEKNRNVPNINFSMYIKNIKNVSIINKSFDDDKRMAENNLEMNINKVMQIPLSLSNNRHLKQIIYATEMSDEDIDDEITIITTTGLCMTQTCIENSCDEFERDTTEDIDSIIILENC